MVVSEHITTRSGQLLFTVEDLPKLIEIGVLSEDDRIELIEGQIYIMSPIGSLHSGLVLTLIDLLKDRFGPQSLLNVQNPIQINERNLPQPDLSILKRRKDYYTSGQPQPSDVFIVIEVSDSTLQADRTTKALLYAQAGIPEYWIVDVVGKALEQYTQPTAEGYKQRVILKAGETVKTTQFPDFALSINQIFRIEDAE